MWMISSQPQPQNKFSAMCWWNWNGMPGFLFSPNQLSEGLCFFSCSYDYTCFAARFSSVESGCWQKKLGTCFETSHRAACEDLPMLKWQLLTCSARGKHVCSDLPGLDIRNQHRNYLVRDMRWNGPKPKFHILYFLKGWSMNKCDKLNTREG